MIASTSPGQIAGSCTSACSKMQSAIVLIVGGMYYKGVC